MNEVASVSTTAVPGLWLMMLKSMGMLCIVIAVLVGILFLVRHLTEKRSGKMNKSLIQLLSSFHVAPKEKVMLLDVVGKKILIGVTQQSINCLAVIEDDKVDTSIKKSGEDFQGILEKTTLSQITAIEDTSKE